ncbi:MAG: hypothetical protein IJU79_00545 [Desulfovibrionaceae bacterium]|nr:hypothetical protein [Desulfovibrionaceae bacterium]
MLDAQPIHILWDASHIWGLMAYRAIRALGLPCRLTKGQEIAGGLLSKKTARLVLVPGGNARRKAYALTPKGLANIREFVAQGGLYLGICGGAGLGLQNSQKDLGLHLCPWPRKPYPERLQHLASGHVKAVLLDNPTKIISLPIWWPGRFAAEPNTNVEIIAKAEAADKDFWLGDLLLASIPKELFAIWRAEYGIDLSSDFLKDAPLIIKGTYGEGRYLLSYAHLETPVSQEANFLLTKLLSWLLKIDLEQKVIPAWDLDTININIEDTYLINAYKKTRELFNLGLEQQLFFRRTPWLFGWRTGLPGAQMNNLHTALASLLQQNLNPKAQAFWQNKALLFAKTFDLWWHSAEESLLTSRIVQALGDLPFPISSKKLKERSYQIFGSPLQGGGLLDQLLSILEELFYINQS